MGNGASCAVDTQLFGVSNDSITPTRPQNTSPNHRRWLVFLLGAAAYQCPRRAFGFICTFKLGVIEGPVLPERPGETPRTLGT